jgi:formate dehydrogenase assembly factor FdhD
MATQPSGSPGDIRERCDSCDAETLHSVTVEIRTESSKTENAEFSREPYRVSTCIRCDTETVQRMNNA